MKTRMTKSVTTLVGPDARVMGNLHFGQGCHVAGLVRGDVMGADDKKAELTMAESGKIEGHAHAAGMLIEGTVVGDLFCSGTVSLGASARVEGSIEYGEIEIAKGAVVTGNLKMMTADSATQASVESGYPATAEDENRVQPLLD